MVSVFCAFGGWALLLPVIPAQMIAAGDGSTFAGLSTGFFMAATVATQAVVPRALRTLGYVPVMIAAALLLGLPAAAYLIDGGPWSVIAVSAVRGIGFGAVTVAQSALLAELVPPRLLGRANGLLGTAIGGAELIGFPLGLFLYDRVGGVVHLVAVAVGVVGALAALGVPSVKAGRPGDEPGVPHAATWKLATVPAIAVCTGAMGFGALSTFTTPAVEEIDPGAAATLAGFTLAVTGLGQIAGRWFAGSVADRVGGPGRCAVAASALAACGVTGVALSLVFAPVGGALVSLVLASAFVFGLGFGAVQSEALLMLFDRLPREKASEASAIWNMSFDSGTGSGAAVLGVIATAAGYGATFAAAGLLVAAGTLVVAADRALGVRRGRVTR